MATVSYITPITNRTYADVEYARVHQDDLENKNIGAWNYTDMNRICNNLKYAAEYMYEQGFLTSPYSIQIKLDWKETDIITYETLNNMIVANMNELKNYSRPDLNWYPMSYLANIDYNIANWIERNIHSLATQIPIPPDKYTLTVENGSGSGDYEANTIVTIQANPAEEGMIFDHWSGDHLENIGNATAMITTYKMPYKNVRLVANYTSTIPHELKIVTYTKTETVNLSMGDIRYIEADPAPEGKVFHHWVVEPSQYESNLYEPAATTHFTMPNEAVTLTAFYINKGQKYLVVNNGNGTGYYEYDSYVAVSSNKPSNATFTNWTGDTQYLTGAVTQEYNSVKIPDVNRITITANWTIPPVTGVKLTVVNGKITSTNETEGEFTQGDKISISANAAPEGYVFAGWSRSGGGSINNSSSSNAVAVIGTEAMTATATYRALEYHTLTVTTNSGTTTSTKERYEQFTVDANPIPDGYLFDKWTGDTHSYETYFNVNSPKTGCYMGTSDRTITANYRLINPHTLTVKQLSGDVTYEQNEGTSISIKAEDAPAGQRFVRWNLSGEGSVYPNSSQTATYYFGKGDATLTPVYVNVWTITVVGGNIDYNNTVAVLDEGSTYRLRTNSLAVYERFDGWTLNGPGSISNRASTNTYFTVGKGNATITANVSQYPDKTLTIYWRDPDTGVDTLASQNTYTYGTKITGIEAEVAPNKSTFSAWLGDTDSLKPSALASTVYIDSITTDMTIIATYYYPKDPDYYTLTVYDGYPESGQYAEGSQISVRAKDPSQGWEFYKWFGDTQYFVDPNLTLSENAVIIPSKSITLYAKFNVIGELPLFRVSVSNGIAKGTYVTGEGEEQVTHEEEGVYIDVPAGTEVTLIADPDTPTHIFDYWESNFEELGITDIITTEKITRFTMVESDVNIQMRRVEKAKHNLYTKNASGAGLIYVGDTRDISGALTDTDDYQYRFEGWTCVDADGNNCIEAIRDPDTTPTVLTMLDKDLWVEAVYTTFYRLTVVEGQDTGDGYYCENQTVNSVRANTPKPETRLQFDHWDDPMGVVQNIYDPTPTIIMKDTIATITAVFVSIDAKGNSVVITGDSLHTGTITRSETKLINGICAVGTIVFDRDGCIGVITQVDPDENDDTDDYKVEKLFYGGNF